MTPNSPRKRRYSSSHRKTRQERQTGICGHITDKKESTPEEVLVKPRLKELREIESFLEDPKPSLWLLKADPFDLDDHCGRVRHTRGSLAKMECLANDMPLPPEKNLNVVQLMLDQINSQDQHEEGLDAKKERVSDVSIDGSDIDEEDDDELVKPLRRIGRRRVARKPLNNTVDDSEAVTSSNDEQIKTERSMHRLSNRDNSPQQSTQADNVVIQREQPPFAVHSGGNVHIFGPASRQYQAFAHFWETIREFSGEVSGPVKIEIPGSVDPGLQPPHTSNLSGQPHDAVNGRIPHIRRVAPRRKRAWSSGTSPEYCVSETEAEKISKTPKPKAFDKYVAAREASRTSRSHMPSSSSWRSKNDFFERYNARAQAGKNSPTKQSNRTRETRDVSICL